MKEYNVAYNNNLLRINRLLYRIIYRIITKEVTN